MSVRIAAVALFAALLLSSPARASFELGPAGYGATVAGEGGEVPQALAGSHPYSLTHSIELAEGGEPLRSLALRLPPGLLENPSAVLKCGPAQFSTPRSSSFEASQSGESCPALSQVGVLQVARAGGERRAFGLFNLIPPSGAPAQLGASPWGIPFVLTQRIREQGGEYGIALESADLAPGLEAANLRLTIWGNPWGPAHQGQRGNCLNEAEPSFPHSKCPLPAAPDHEPFAYLTLPTSCDTPLDFRLTARSWAGSSLAASSPGGGLEDCEALRFEPRAFARPTNPRASSPSGYELTFTPKEDALTRYTGRVPSPPRRVTVSLPEGMTVNPSLAAGLGACSASGYAAETASSPPGAGCTQRSKIGSFTVRSPLFEETIDGAVYLAQPDDPTTTRDGAENPFDSLLALYLVAKSAERGILIKVAGQIEADPRSGELTATFDRLPQLPYTDLNVRLRAGQRAPLITPAACGAFVTRVELSPWNDPGHVVVTAEPYEVEKGIGPGGACPSGTAPFRPGAVGGSLNSSSGAHSAFYLRLTRTDAEQELTSYSALLPRGLTGRLAGVAVCPDAALAAAARRTGKEEEARPSCPAASQIGRTVSGYGVGPVLAYAPGKMYLAGPYRGRPLSVVAVNSATVGPFDLGVIAIRSAFSVDPHTGQLAIDSAASDPIPHILAGIPLHLRDVRIHIDRPGFTLNPTSCDPTSFSSFLGGSGARFGDRTDDTVAAVANHFQVTNCSAQGFRPRLALRLRGPTRRGAYPALRAVLRPRAGHANLRRIAVTLPRTQFLAQNHIRDVCTRQRFAAGSCPRGSVYGRAAAWTPLLDGPLRGPVYLRSSENPLPDLVADLRNGPIRIIAAGRIDSAGRGRIRAIFTDLPDAPLDRFVLQMRGGARGALVNSAGVCHIRAFAYARMVAHNNRGRVARPRLQAGCGGKRRGRGGGRQRAGRG